MNPIQHALEINNGKAILLSIKKEWLDKIMAGDKVMGVPTLTFLIPDKFKTPEQICHEKEYKRGMDEYSNYVRKQQEEEEQRRRWDEAEERLNHHH